MTDVVYVNLNYEYVLYMKQELDEKKNDISIGDELVLLPHRVLSLGRNKIAVISESSNGWCIASVESYLYVSKIFLEKKIIFNDDLIKEIDLIKSFWNFNLLKKNGSCISDLIQPCSPLLLVLKITGNCNFGCSYCYDYGEDRVGKVIPIDKTKKAISFILSQNKKISMIFHGGEPLLNFLLIKEIVEFSLQESGNNKNISFMIQTNGSLLNKEIISFLDQHNFSIGLSLDGMTENANKLRTTVNASNFASVF